VDDPMSARTRLAISGLVLAAVSAGCDDPVDPSGTLTEAEALALFKSVTEGLELLELGPGEDTEPGPMDTTLACPHGGRARIAGSATGGVVGDTARIVVRAVVTPAGCEVLGDAMMFTVDGDPGLRTELAVDIIGFEKIVMGGGVEGDIRWRLEDRSGDCAIDLPLDATADLSNLDDPEVTGGFKGKMCGHDIQFDIPPPSLN